MNGTIREEMDLEKLVNSVKLFDMMATSKIY
jgi:hypothetical protein